jgi:hypothetical protein
MCATDHFNGVVAVAELNRRAVAADDRTGIAQRDVAVAAKHAKSLGARLGTTGKILCGIAADFSALASPLVLDPNSHSRLKACRLSLRIEAQAKRVAVMIFTP